MFGRKSFLALVIGFTLVFFGLFMIYVALFAETWPSTDGKIIGFSGYDTGAVRKYVQVHYTYVVDDKPHHGVIGSPKNWIALFDLGKNSIIGFTDKEEAISYMWAHYGRKGDFVTVHYHPWLHQLSVLKTGFKNSAYIAISLILILMGLIRLVF